MPGITSDLAQKIRRPPAEGLRGVSGRFLPGQHCRATRYTVDLGIFNEFATAAFRFGHSLIPEGFKMKSHSLTKLLLNLNDTQSMAHKKQ